MCLNYRIHCNFHTCCSNLPTSYYYVADYQLIKTYFCAISWTALCHEYDMTLKHLLYTVYIIIIIIIIYFFFT